MEPTKRIKNKDWVNPMREVAPGIYRGGNVVDEFDSVLKEITKSAVDNLNAPEKPTTPKK